MSGFLVPLVQVMYNGAVAPGAKVHVYESETTSEVTVYADGDLTTPLTNPVTCDSNGQCVFYVAQTDPLRILTKTSGGVVIRDFDPVIPVPSFAGLTASVSELNKVDGLTATTAELNTLAGVVAGTVAASKAVVVDASKNIGTFGDVGMASISGTAVASQAEMEAGSATNKAVTPGRMQHHKGVAKFWLVCDAGGNILDSYNVASITDVSAGRVNVTLTTAFSSANWKHDVQILDASTPLVAQAIAKTSSTINVICHNLSGVATDPTQWSIAGYGDQ